MKRAQRRKYHYIYKTICVINNKYYYGMHSTDNLFDGYLGSGTILSRSIKKHGKDNHEIEILEYLPNREKLRKREQEIVNEELIQDKLCMNLCIGGSGGGESFITLNQNSEVQKIKSAKANVVLKQKRLENPNWVLEINNKISKAAKGHKRWLGKTHSVDAKSKMSDSHKGKHNGELNSQYGKCWITNGKENKKIFKGDSFSEDWRLGRVMK